MVVAIVVTAVHWLILPPERPVHWVTIIEACSAEGQYIAPLVLFKGKELQSSWFPENIPSDRYFQCTENAFTSNQVGLNWLQQVFLPQTENDGGTQLLLCDNHGSHITVPFMFNCYTHGVQLLFMPSHSWHILQPLDVGVFLILKREYRKCQELPTTKALASVTLHPRAVPRAGPEHRDRRLPASSLSSPFLTTGVIIVLRLNLPSLLLIAYF